MNIPKNLQLLHKHVNPGQVFLDINWTNNHALFATYTGVSYIDPVKINIESLLPKRYVLRVRRAAEARARSIAMSEPRTILDIHKQLNTVEDEYLQWAGMHFVNMRVSVNT